MLYVLTRPNCMQHCDCLRFAGFSDCKERRHWSEFWGEYLDLIDGRLEKIAYWGTLWSMFFTRVNRMISSGDITWAGRVARMWDRHKWYDNINMGLKEAKCETVHWSLLIHDGPVAGSWRFIKGREFFGCQLLKNCSLDYDEWTGRPQF